MNFSTLVNLLIAKLGFMANPRVPINWREVFGGMPPPNDTKTLAEYNAITVSQAVVEIRRWLETERTESRGGKEVDVPWVSDQEVKMHRERLQQALQEVIDPDKWNKPEVSNLPDYQAIAELVKDLQ